MKGISVFSNGKLSSRSEINIDLALTLLEKVSFESVMITGTAEDHLLYTMSGPNHP